MNRTQSNDATQEVWRTVRKTISQANGPSYVLFDATSTANGMPGIHHVLVRAPRAFSFLYRTTCLCRVPWRAAWGTPIDCSAEVFGAPDRVYLLIGDTSPAFRRRTRRRLCKVVDRSADSFAVFGAECLPDRG